MSDSTSRGRAILCVALALAIISSFAGAYPLTNVVMNGNKGEWFTIGNIQAYGDDLDERAGPDDRVFTGHPSYVAASDVRMLMDMPRIHYFAVTFWDHRVGDEFYANLTRQLESGRAQWAISGPMTKAVLKYNLTAQKAFVSHYCKVDDEKAQALYAKTGATLYRWVNDSSECPPRLRPDVQNMSSKA